VVDGKMGELVRAARLTRELESTCHDPREPIVRKIRRMQRVQSPDLPAPIRALRSCDPAWASRFAAEAGRLCTALGDAVLRIEHFGSTAVSSPALSAKNVVDFLVALRDAAAVREADGALAALGYTCFGNGPCDPETTWWWRIEGEEVAFVAHLCEAANPWIETVVDFRDYLRAHPGECARYEEVKRHLAAEPDRSLFEYSLGKLRLFYEISGKAGAWRRGGAVSEGGQS